jgi:hypothetical protein
MTDKFEWPSGKRRAVRRLPPECRRETLFTGLLTQWLFRITLKITISRTSIACHRSSVLALYGATGARGLRLVGLAKHLDNKWWRAVVGIPVSHWRRCVHEEPPSGRRAGRQRRTPLTLDLYYLITPLLTDAFDRQVVLGKIMQVLYDQPTLEGPDLVGSPATAGDDFAIRSGRDTPYYLPADVTVAHRPRSGQGPNSEIFNDFRAKPPAAWVCSSFAPSVSAEFLDDANVERARA